MIERTASNMNKFNALMVSSPDGTDPDAVMVKILNATTAIKQIGDH